MNTKASEKFKYVIGTTLLLVALGINTFAASYADIDGDGIQDKILHPGEEGFSVTVDSWDTYCYDYLWYPLNSYWDNYDAYWSDFGIYSDYASLKFDIEPFWDYGYSYYAWCDTYVDGKISFQSKPGEQYMLLEDMSGIPYVYNINLWPHFGWTIFGVEIDIEEYWPGWRHILDWIEAKWFLVIRGKPALSQNHELWWLNGASQPGWYFQTATITASPVTTGTFQWDVVQGADKVNLNNGGSDSDSILAVDDNTITVKSTAPSDATPGVTNDVKIRLTYNDGSNGDLVTNIWLSVFAPDHMVPLPSMNTHESFGNGYKSQIWYRLEDQFNRTLSVPIDLNEDIDGNGIYSNPATLKAAEIDDWANQDWEWGEEAGGQVTPSGVFDTILRPVGNYPSIQNPRSPLQYVEVVHSPVGAIYIGSETIGDGVKVIDQIWQMYRDHAEHILVLGM